jgi:TonB family protein
MPTKTLGVFFLLISVCLHILGCEQEGSVKIEDCRETIFLSSEKGIKPFERPIQHLLRDFTCTYERTEDKRHIISGICIAVENATFHTECLKAYMYFRASEIACMEKAHAEKDGKCHCNYGYSYNDVAGQCVQTTGGAVSDSEGQLRTQQARQETTATKTATEGQLRAYQAELQAKITNAWKIPPQSKDLHAEVVLIVDRAGNVELARLVQGSGNGPFDDSLQQAIKQAQPLPALPEDYAAPSLRVTLHFRGRG